MPQRSGRDLLASSLQLQPLHTLATRPYLLSAVSFPSHFHLKPRMRY